MMLDGYKQYSCFIFKTDKQSKESKRILTFEEVEQTNVWNLAWKLALKIN